VAVASLSIRDILPLIAKANIDRSIKDISSPLVSVNKNTTIKDAVDLMFRKGIRNIGVNHNVDNDNNNNKIKLLRIINDRKILEFLLSHDGKELMRKKWYRRFGRCRYYQSLRHDNCKERDERYHGKQGS
jgi:CBS domain-containing protein